jgi:DNA modification methylase
VRCERVGDATLYHARCEDVLPGLERFDAVVTDPPYGTQDLAGGYGRRQNWDLGDGLGRVIANDSDLSALATAMPSLLPRVQDGWMMVFYAPRRTPQFISATQPAEWFGEIIWDKAQPGLGYHIRYAHENIAVFRIGKPLRPPEPLLSVVRAPSSPELHPHQKPVSLMASLVRWASPVGGVVLDPFMGVGSTGVACALHGRRFAGIELDPKHFDAACRRIEAAYKQADLFVAPPPKPEQPDIFEARFLPHGAEPAADETVHPLRGHHSAYSRLAVRPSARGEAPTPPRASTGSMERADAPAGK